MIEMANLSKTITRRQGVPVSTLTVWAPAQARELAALIIDAANELDRWTVR